VVSLAALLAGAERRHDGLSATIPDNWLQGRTAYGGISAALALTAARGLADDLPPLRSAQISFVGPLDGTVSAAASMLRRGRSASFVDARVDGGDRALGLRATLLFAADRESAMDHRDSAPPADLPAPEDVPDMPTPPGTPAFFHNFEYRTIRPAAGKPAPDLLMWVRFRDPAGLDPLTELIAVADALPPAAIGLMRSLRPVSSMTWLLNILTPTPATRDHWWLLRSTAEHVRDGFSSQSMAIWNRDGEAVVRGMQSVAVFG
jgi:acyl-CoA thioesterase